MKYAIPFEITGAVEIEAKDAVEAQEQFGRMSFHQIADFGELEAQEPEPIWVDLLPKKSPEGVGG